MPRGYRTIVIAAVGWLALTGAQPKPAASHEQSYAYSRVGNALSNVAAINDKQTKRSERAPESPPCGPRQYQGKDDVCAQWKAADAAADSAWWAAFAGWFGGLNFLGVLAAIGLAFHSNWIARDTAKRQLRAYVGYSNEWYHNEFALGQELLLKPRIANFGETPARNVIWQAQLEMISDPDADNAFILSPLQPGSKSTLGKGQWTQTRLSVTPNAGHYALITSGAAKLYVFGSISYTDIFGDEWSTTFRFVLIPGEQRWAMCAEGNEST